MSSRPDHVGSNASSPSTAPTQTDAGTAIDTAPSPTLLEASLWWLNLEIFNSPGKVLLLASAPILGGAYFGYKIPASTIENLAGMRDTTTGPAITASSSSTSSSSTLPQTLTYADLDAQTRAQRRALGVATARQAFRVATLGTIGAFSVFGGLFCFARGYGSLQEAHVELRGWGRSIHSTLERWMGGDTAPSKSHPDAVATRGMTGDEEWQYVYDKYIRAAAEEEMERPASSSSGREATTESIQSPPQPGKRT